MWRSQTGIFGGSEEGKSQSPKDIVCMKQFSTNEKSWSLRNEEESKWGEIGRGEQASDQGNFYERLKSFHCILNRKALEDLKQKVWVSDVIQLKTRSSLWREGAVTKDGMVTASDYKGDFRFNPGETWQSYGEW